MQRYPIGLQDFKGIIEGNYLYVDKTYYAWQLVSSYKYYFLSRPRRFGKSLFLSMLDYLFQGKKELFKGLFIEDKWSFEPYPVIKISFSNIGYRTQGLLKAIDHELDIKAEREGITFQSKAGAIDLKFKELLLEMSDKYQRQVVILIDEYDKPIIDYLAAESISTARENRAILKSFYSVLKDADPHLKLVFITGVSKFSQVSIFSDLNNLYDITLDQGYHGICGISQTELEQYFPAELDQYNRGKIQSWYNGYRWNTTKEETYYNPFSLLRFFGGGGEFQNFWYSTGTPTFLLDMSKELGVYDIKNAVITKIALNSYSIDNIQLIPLLFQTGYLTIKGYDDLLELYELDYPNQEVRSSYLEGLLETYTGRQEAITPTVMRDMLKALRQKDPNALQNAINAVYEHIPYDLWQRENEHFYHAIIHLLFSLLGVYIQSEVHTKNGRADALIQIPEGIFCLEFKLDQSAEAAIEQIKSRGYLSAYANGDKPCYAIGINFSSVKKQVEKLIWEEF